MGIPPRYDDDPWQLRPAKADGLPMGPHVLHVDTIKELEPLNAQLGVLSKKTVPDALYEAFFGHPDAMQIENETGSNASSVLPRMHSYAILDAAKILNLPNMLEQSNLEYRCLFKGSAYDDMKDVAPWIVRLEEGNTFTRNLFTRSDAPWHLWDADPAIYARSPKNLEEMWQHLRKFTRLTDEDGTVFMFRFWESAWAGALLESYFDDGLYRIFDGVAMIMVREEGVIRQFRRGGDDANTRRPIILSKAGTLRYLKFRQERLCKQLLLHFSKLSEFSTWDPKKLERRIEAYIVEGMRLGLRDGADLFYMALGLCLSDDPAKLRRQISLVELPETNVSARQEAILELVRRPIDLAKARQRAHLESTV